MGLAVVKSGRRRNLVALIRVDGQIAENSASPGLLGGGGASSRTFHTLVQEALVDSHIKAVVVRVNSPRGGVVASAQMYDALRRLNAHKPVVISMGEEAASGGYYLSCAAGIHGTPVIDQLQSQPGLFGSLQQRLGVGPTQAQLTFPQLGGVTPGYSLQYLALPPGE